MWASVRCGDDSLITHPGKWIAGCQQAELLLRPLHGREVALIWSIGSKQGALPAHRPPRNGPGGARQFQACRCLLAPRKPTVDSQAQESGGDPQRHGDIEERHLLSPEPEQGVCVH